MTSSDAVLAGP